ncbi:MAG: Maf family protein [Coriobacteriales bacterium]|nr:Maf family protein [Coriobacteriales bacterium]
MSECDKGTVEVVLASGSPRREAILRAHGIQPTIILPQIDEHIDAGGQCVGGESADGKDVALSPGEMVEVLALRKARDVWQRLVTGEVAWGQARASSAQLDDLARRTRIIGADTVVYKEGRGVLGKPAGHDEAVSMLEALRNTAHHVYTGVAVVCMLDGEATTFVDVSTVHFGDYSRDDIEAFLEAEPPYDKAGAYAAQGIWAAHITRIDGDLENVIGLPWHRLAPLLTAKT